MQWLKRMASLVFHREKPLVSNNHCILCPETRKMSETQPIANFKLFTHQTDHRFPLQHYSSSSRSDRQGRQSPDLYDLHDLYDLLPKAHVAGWEPYNLHDLGRVCWVGSVQYRS